MSRRLVLLTIALAVGKLPAFVPLPADPSWTSNDNDFSTGGAFADLDTNGFLDYCTSNGNDMANDRNAVYFNHSGTLEAAASWRSADRGMFGHCYAGDVNNDGLADLAVACLGPDTSQSPLVARIYRNLGAGLDTVPYWRAADRHSSFDCCLGDFDLDADLDLAITSGDAYRSQRDPARVYRNDSGVFDTLPCWIASDSTASDAIRFCDIDDDDDLDLFVGQRGKVSMYRNDAGALQNPPAWQARTGVGWVLRLAFGDFDRDGFPDLAAASNGQLGDPNNIKVFHNQGGALDTLATFTMLASEDYSSCVAWGDANGDEYPELAAGGWWDPLVVFENCAGTLSTVPDWSWYPEAPEALVCETAMWGDVANSHLVPKAELRSGNGQRRLFNLSRVSIQFLDSVKVEGTRIPVSDFCYDPLVGWVSLATPPPAGTDNVAIYYQTSTHQDLAVTNWEESFGNHLFLNTAGPALASEPGPTLFPALAACPNPMTGRTVVRAPGLTQACPLRIYCPDGRLAATLAPQPGRSGTTWFWDGCDQDRSPVRPGVYLALESATGACVKVVRTAIR